jgi:hypothetical protein
MAAEERAVRNLIHSMLRRFRGVVGLGIVAGGIGLLGGAIYGLVSTLLGTGFFWDPGYLSFLLRRVAGSAAYWGLPAAFAGTGFGALLAVGHGKRSLEELPVWRMGLFGAVGGTLFIPAFLVARFGVGVLLDFPFSLLSSMAMLGGLGAVLTSSMVAMAKRARREELSAADEVSLLKGL